MNDFYNGPNCHGKCSFLIQKGSLLDASKIESEIDNKFPNKIGNQGSGLLYVYYYADLTYKYPDGESNVLYIGHTCGQQKNGKISLGFRFKHLKAGKDNKQNITLSAVYDKNAVLGLDIFMIENCAEEERKLRYKFLQKYKALPIADGAAYKKDKCEVLTDSIDDIL